MLATTLSSVYLAMRHIFPDVPISAGAFEPLIVKRPEGTFLDAKYPRPVSGCAAEVSQRIAEAVFAAMVQALPDKVTAAPAGSSGNFALGGNDPARGRDYVMYQISGGGYGGNAGHDGLTNGCSTIGISKSPPVEIMEQAFPVLYRHYALREGSGGAGKHRGGFGLAYEVEILRGEARASFVMDHGRFGPQGALGGKDGAVNTVTVFRNGEAHVPPHLSKEQDIALKAGDRVRVGTPGGGGYGDPFARDADLVRRDVALGYYTPERSRREIRRRFVGGWAGDRAAWRRKNSALFRTLKRVAFEGIHATRFKLSLCFYACRCPKPLRTFGRHALAQLGQQLQEGGRLPGGERRQRFLGNVAGDRDQSLDRVAALRGQIDQQAPLVDLVLGKVDQAARLQPVDDALDRRRVHGDQRAELVLRGFADVAQLGQSGELRRRQIGDMRGEDRDMALVRLAQDEADLLLQPVFARPRRLGLDQLRGDCPRRSPQTRPRP